MADRKNLASQKSQSAMVAAERAAVERAEVATAVVPIDQRAGAAIREHRLERSLTLAELASAADMSVAMLSRIENGQSAASLEVIERVCAALGVDMSTLFRAIEDTAGSAQLIKASEQMEVVRTGTKHGHTYRLLSYHKGPRKIFEPFFIEMDKLSDVYPRFQHPGTEFIYMLSGRMEYRFGDKTFLVEPGDAFTFSGSVIHGPETLLDEHIRFLAIIIYAE
jgi:transcriptional regulator with XRE-family HTH domain